jgi:hypothetical protein
MGTVLSLFDQPLQRLVWEGKLDIKPMFGNMPELDSKQSAGHSIISIAGRRLEIFLDMLAAYATENHSYLLAPAYTRGLSQDERELREQLLALAKRPRSDATAEVWRVIDDALADLGYCAGHDHEALESL